MLSSAWSPDNEYLITGGEDDLVVVWSATDKCPVARFRVSGLGFRVYADILYAHTAPSAGVLGFRV